MNISAPSVQSRIQVRSNPFHNHLIGVLRRHADERPQQPACIHLLEGKDGQINLNYAELDRRARAIAARLQDMGFEMDLTGLEFWIGLKAR